MLFDFDDLRRSLARTNQRDVGRGTVSRGLSQSQPAFCIYKGGHLDSRTWGDFWRSEMADGPLKRFDQPIPLKVLTFPG